MTKEEAIKELELITHLTIWNERREAVEMAIEALEQEPVKHGRWEDTKHVNVRKCSCCQAEWGIYSIEDFDYCPSCGAKMDKGGDTE